LGRALGPCFKMRLFHGSIIQIYGVSATSKCIQKALLNFEYPAILCL
jgi:hypothetical protein